MPHLSHDETVAKVGHPALWAYELLLGGAGSGHEDGVEGEVFEEGDLDADGDDLGDVVLEVLAAGAEIGEILVAGAAELNSGGDEGGVELHDKAELDFEAELHAGG